MLSKPKRNFIEQVKRYVAAYYGYDKDIMDSKRRMRDIAQIRMLAIYLIYENSDLSFPQIGEAFGGRDHTTAMHAFKTTKRRIDESIYLQNDVMEIIDVLKIAGALYNYTPIPKQTREKTRFCQFAINPNIEQAFMQGASFDDISDTEIDAAGSYRPAGYSYEANMHVCSPRGADIAETLLRGCHA